MLRPALLTLALTLSGLAVLPATPAHAAEPAVTTLAGGLRGDGGPATGALLDAISAAEAPDGTIWIAEDGRTDLRRVDGTTGVVTSVPTSVNGIRKIEVDGSGRPYVMTSGTIFRLATDGTTQWYGGLPGGYVVDFDVAADGTLYAVGEEGAQHIATDGTRTTIAPSGVRRIAVAPDATVYVTTFDGIERISGGVTEPVSDADWVQAMDVAPDGTLYVADNSVFFRVEPDGSTEYVAETTRHCTWDWFEVTATRLLSPCVRVEAFDPATGAGTVVAGTTATGSPDGTPTGRSWETAVRGVAVGTDGLVYYSAADRLRRIEDDGTVSTVASGLTPYRLAAAPDGSIYVANGTSVRRVAGGVVTTVATADYVYGVAVDGDGVVWFVDGDRQVWRVVAGTPVAVGSPLLEHYSCCDLTYDPAADRVLAVTGLTVEAVAADGTRTLVAPMSATNAAAGPDGAVYGSFGWARRGDVLTRFFSENTVPAQLAVTADGQVVLADPARRAVRVVEPLPAPDVPAVGTVTATPGPGRVTFELDRPSPDPWAIRVLAHEGSIAPGTPGEGTFVADTTSETPGDVTLVWDRNADGNRTLTAVPRSVSFFVGKPDSDDYVVRTLTVTPLADDEGPAPVTDVALDLVHNRVTYTKSASYDAIADAFVRWSYGTTAPATLADGDGGGTQLPQYARYQDDVTFSLWARDHDENFSEPVTIVMPKLTETSGGPSPAWLSYESDQAFGAMRLDHAKGTVKMAVGDVAPATVADGQWPKCGCNEDTVTLAEGLTYGTHYSFALFTRTADGEHYTRVPYTAVFGANTTPDAITIGGASTVTTGGLVTLSGTVKQGGTNQPRPSTRVELWARTPPSTTYTKVASGTTTSTATYSFTVRPRTNTYYQVRSGATDPMAPPRAVSPSRLVIVTPKVAIKLSATRVSAGRAVRVYGSIAPTGRRTLKLQRWTSSGWLTVTTKTTDSYGRTYYDLTRARGTYKLRWWAPTSTQLNQAVSATASFTVY